MVSVSHPSKEGTGGIVLVPLSNTPPVYKVYEEPYRKANVRVN